MALFGRKKKAVKETPVSAPQLENDTLTGLLSLDKFYADAAACIRYYPEGAFAFCRISVGNIAAINETYGWESGNKVLRAAAEALAADDSHSIIARDRSKFVMMLRYDTKDELDRRLDALHSRLSTIGNCLPANPKVYMHTGVFSTEGRLTDKTVEEMVACAKIAESEASKRTHESVVFYTEQLRRAAAEEAELQNSMEEALRKKQFAVCLQPKFNMQTGEVTGAKIMSRWLHPKLGVIGSYRYVPLFVKNGFILKLDLYLFEQACSIIKKWIDKGYTPIPLSLNVPRALLADKRNMTDYVELKKKYKIPDGLCELEFSERLVDDKVTTIGAVFEYFRNNGFLCTVENFGAGNASLSTITGFPIDAVKFSRNYFDNGLPSEDEQQQIRSAIAAAKSAGVQTSATGVPDAAVPLLKEMGCDILQGASAETPLTVDEFNDRYMKQ